ncbi:MAG TPA: 50S ribosomal protein L11 methyltransferase, partial [Alcanivorax sp.]|nr:50S ribosomal protein L11 methyltransferase [Alcanivorax sp.]HBS13308.1 50S ribosomal protein L11 methyltransferase [Alcanivorax sp.]HBT06513.1 50S ribosomal protein L11 methyltransferase [Alcanivorax sp.]HCO65802.1 50S ribosomal protein L11 methyltransferase [Alcanivorax sp.]
MSWLQLHIATDPDHADAFQDALEALGAGAVTLTDGADQPV